MTSPHPLFVAGFRVPSMSSFPLSGPLNQGHNYWLFPKIFVSLLQQCVYLAGWIIILVLQVYGWVRGLALLFFYWQPACLLVFNTVRAGFFGFKLQRAL